MKKIFKFLIAAIFAAVSTASYAQWNVSGHKFLDNWSVGVNGGVTTNLNDWDKPNGGLWGVTLTKGITPAFALEFEGQAGMNNNANWNVPHSSNVFDNLSVTAAGKVNLFNLFFGYAGKPRFFEIDFRGGAGYMCGYYPENNNNSMIAKTGLDFNFNVGKERAMTITVRPAVVFKGDNGDAWCDNSNKVVYAHNATAQITAGLVYHFGNKSYKNHYFTTVPPVIKTVEKIKVVEKVVEKVIENEKVVEKVVDKVRVVTFAFDSFVLTDEAKAILNGIDAGTTVTVLGYASPEGKASYNQKLSEHRALAVRDYLNNRGVNVAKAEGVGVKDKASQRIAVVTVE